jgi:formaldehyde-activating enzyme involved in methanogenesis
MACAGCQQPTWVRLLLGQLVVAAATAGEVAGTAESFFILNLDAARVVDGLAVTAHARQLPVDSNHERILPREKEQDWAIQEADFIMVRVATRARQISQL